VRLFLAVIPPVEVQRAAFAACEGLRRPADDVSWVRPENLHFTLRFLGEVGEDTARGAAEAAAEAASAHAPFDASLGRAGAFPGARRARVLWLSLATGAEAMKALAASLEAALVDHGFDPADKPFSPHLTIGRVREPKHDWSARLAEVPATDAAFRVERITLVESRLARGGSVYTMRSEALLGD
jgi:RNA 2',3'-cyclic 3'-phosphodiesterase